MDMRFFEWLDCNKSKDLLRVQLCKLIYTIEIATIPHIVISAISGIIIPILWTNHFIYAIYLLIFFILENISYYICEKYHVKTFDERKFATNLLEDQSALLNSLAIMINDNQSWKTEIFKKTCDMVCTKIHEEFKNVYKCDVRVSVEYIFEKNIDGVNEICRKMAGRCSNSRSQSKRATKLISRRKYYSYKIFNENLIGIHYLVKDDIDNQEIWFKNPQHNIEVIQYVGLANSFNDQDVSFILQIDCLDNFNFGNNNTEKEMKRFVNTYLKPYVNIISIAYLLGRNKNGKVGEVT